MALRLTFLGTDSLPVEVEGLTPDWAGGKALSEIERLPIFHGNRRLPLADLFRVSGDAADGRFDLEGNLESVHWIGAHMSAGEIHVHGSAGRHVGSQMRGGTIQVSGNCGGWAGAEMEGGLIRIQGNAGDLAGGAYRGSTKGMRGGTLLIAGDAGHEVGHSMRRGVIAVGGAAGALAGCHMIAGTVLVFGDCGARPGAGMRRGTLGLFGPRPPELLSSFRYGSTYRPQFLSLVLRDLVARSFRVDEALFESEFTLHHGDSLTLGKGEILLRSQSLTHA